jgi:hypothetical protein
MKKNLSPLLAAALALFGLRPCESLAFGAAPYAFVSILGGRDYPGCGLEASPCRTAQYAHDRVVREGGVIYVRDVGDFGAPSVFTAISIAAGVFGDWAR